MSNATRVRVPAGFLGDVADFARRAAKGEVEAREAHRLAALCAVAALTGDDIVDEVEAAAGAAK
jgi:hypothetical protein